MNLSKFQRYKLISLKSALLRKTTESALKGEYDEAKTHKESVELIDELLSRSKTRFEQIQLPLVIGSICVLALWALITFHEYHPHVFLKVYTRGINVRTAADWQSKMASPRDFIYADSIILTNVRSAEALGIKSSIDLDTTSDNSLLLQGGDSVGVYISELQLTKRTLLNLEASKAMLSVRSRGRALRTKFELQSGYLRVNSKPVNATAIKSSDPSETIASVTRNQNSLETNLVVYGHQSAELHGVSVDSINFVEEEIPNYGHLESLIDSATIVFAETGIKRSLSSSDVLWIEPDLNNRVSISRTGDRLLVQYTGKVKSMTTGFDDSPINMIPTYLEYFYNKKSLALFFSAAGFIWGLLWSFYTLITKKK